MNDHQSLPSPKAWAVECATELFRRNVKPEEFNAAPAQGNIEQTRHNSRVMSELERLWNLSR